MEASLVRAAARHALRIARCNCGEKGKGGGGRKARGRISSRCVSHSTAFQTGSERCRECRSDPKRYPAAGVTT